MKEHADNPVVRYKTPLSRDEILDRTNAANRLCECGHGRARHTEGGNWHPSGCFGTIRDGRVCPCNEWTPR